MEAELSLESVHDVYHKIRLERPLQDSDGKLKWVMNGISANSWFTPCGITDRSEKTSTPYGPVTDEIRVCLQERAQSAASFLGRRHFETDKQELKTHEVLRGHNVYSKKNNEVINVKDDTDNKKGRFCGKCLSASPREIRNKILVQRPQTSYGVRTKANVDTDVIRPKIESLTIQERKSQTVINNKKSTCELCNHANTLMDLKENDSSKTDKVENSNVGKSNKSDTTFKSEGEMKKAFRACSAPPPSTDRKDFLEGMVLQRPTGEATPLYWKTRTDYHRKQLAGSEPEDMNKRLEYFSKGSLLKPLMYQKGSDLKHSAGCPYQCKGCFRACLVSQDYLEAMKQRKSQSIRKKRYVRPKLYHRRIIELALAKSQPIHKMIERKNIWNK